MTTKLMSIDEFNTGDLFIHYGATFKVTSDVKVFIDVVTYYGRRCELINDPNPNSNISGLLASYNWMQGTKDVLYAKIID